MSSRASQRGRVTLADLAQINPRAIRPKLKPTDQVSFIPMADVTETGEWEVRRTMPLASVSTGYTQFLEGDILFAKITPCAENGKGTHARDLTNGIGYGSTEFHVLRPNAGIDPTFIFQVCQWPEARRRAARMMVGSAGQQRVPQDFFETFTVPATTVDHHERIGNLLDSAEAAVSAANTFIIQLKRILNESIDTWIGGGKASSTWSDFDHCLKAGLQNGIYCHESVYGNGTNILRITDYEGGQILNAPPPRRVEISESDIKSYGLRENDIVINRVNSLSHLGKAALIGDLKDPVVFESNMMRLSVDRSRALPKFVLLMLNSAHVRTQIRRLAKRAIAQCSIDQTDVRSLRFPLPPIPEQQRLIDLTSSMRRSINANQQSLIQLRRVKDAICQELFA